MAEAINIGKIQADLEVDSGRLEQGIAKGREALRRIQLEVKQLQEDVKSGALGAQEYQDRFRGLEKVFGDLAFRMEAAYAAIGKTSNVFDIANKSSVNYGRAVLELSRGMEDLQYGVNGVLNNIPPLVQAVGGSAGIAGAVSLAAVGVTVLVRHWDDLMRVFGMDGTRTAAQEMEELRKKTSLTADEAERLHRASEVKGKVDELRKAKTKSEKDTETAVTEALTKAGPQDVARAIVKNAPEVLAGQGDVAKAKAAMESARAEIPGTFDAKTGEHRASPLEIEQHRAKVLQTEEDYRKALERAAEGVAGSAALPQLFPGGLKQLTGLVEKHTSDFGPGGDQLLLDLKAATPEARTKKKIGDALSKAWDQVTAGFDKDVAAQVKKNKVQDKKDDKAEDKDSADKQRRENEWRKKNLETADLANPGLRDAVRRRLDEARRTGGKEDDVVAYFTENLTAHGNLTPEQAKAAAKDAVVRARNELNRTGQAGVDRRTNKERKDRLERAEEAIPGLEELAKFDVHSALLSGASLRGVTDRIMGKLKVQGWTQGDSRRAAQDTVEDATHDVAKGAVKDYVKAMERMDEVRERERLNARSAVIGGESLTNYIQSSIGQTSEMQKQTRELVKASAFLEKIANKNVLELIVE